MESCFYENLCNSSALAVQLIRPIFTDLTELLSTELHAEPTHWWTEVKSDDKTWDLATFWVAAHIAQVRCGGAPQFFNAWINRWLGGGPHTPELYDVLLAFFGSESIGTPANPSPQGHLEGFVAEHIWHALAEEGSLGLGQPTKVDGPDWSVTDPGGDGLVIYRSNDSTLMFRLWELKAHSSGEDVPTVVNGACRQLDANALRYLARFSKVGQSLSDPELQIFYGQLPEIWRCSSSPGGGGVGVTTVQIASSGDWFSNIGNYWGFSGSSQRLGLLVMIADFPKFALRVREHLWKGL